MSRSLTRFSARVISILSPRSEFAKVSRKSSAMISLRRRYVCSGPIAFVETRNKVIAWRKNAYNFDEQSAVKQLIMERFDIYAEKNGVGSPEETTASNGHKEGDSASAVLSPPPSSSPVKRDPDSEASSLVGSEPPAKKRKSEADADADVDADAVFAAKLQAEENLRARPTRGGTTRRAAPSKKKSKAKTSKRVKAEDDSDIESGSDTTTKKEVNRTGGFHVRGHCQGCIQKLSFLTLAETSQSLAASVCAAGWRSDSKIFSHLAQVLVTNSFT